MPGFFFDLSNFSRGGTGRVSKARQKVTGVSDIITTSIDTKTEESPMNTSIVLTILADDQPGIIQAVSSVLNKHGGSWTQSSMSSLAGQFAGILLVSLPSEHSVACQQELQGLESQGLHVIAHICDKTNETEKTSEYVFDLVGNDRQGIVHDITTILAKHNVNVRNLETVIEAASMGGAELFRARAELLVPASTDIDLLAKELEDLANDLMVNITFEK